MKGNKVYETPLQKSVMIEVETALLSASIIKDEAEVTIERQTGDMTEDLDYTLFTWD